MADLLGNGVGGEGCVEPAAGVADEDISGSNRSDDRGSAVGKGGLLVDQGAVPR